MSRTFARLLIALVAFAHAAFFIAYQSPDWLTEWTDQAGYTRLGRALAETGRFTRYPDYPQRFIPEVLRTPGYPLFVAAVNRTLGDGQFPVAMAQAAVFAAICLTVYAIARLIASDRTAFAAGLVTALYPTLPYFAALTLTEVFTTFVVTLGLYLWLRALRDGRGWTVGAGVALGWAALTRPPFEYLSVALVLFACVVAPRSRAAIRRSALLLAVCAVVVAPWLLYNVTYLHSFTFTPAGGIGRGLWEGAWQVRFPGRVQANLIRMAETTWDRGRLDSQVRAYSRKTSIDEALMLRYVHEWQDIRQMWDSPRDPWERAVKRIEADHEYQRVALENIRLDPLRHIWRRATLGVALLWITDIPVRYTDINTLPRLAIRAMWLVQAFIMAAALAGLYVLWRSHARAEAAAFAALILYVTAVYAVLFSEARYSLPAKPVVLLLATMAVARVLERMKAGGGARVTGQAPALSVTD